MSRTACKYADRRYFIAAPVRPQAKAIYWNDMKALLKGNYNEKDVSETDLSITLKNGSFIQLFGLGGKSSGARIEGTPWDGGIIDEYANCPKDVFQHNIRPALADRKGWCWFIGVPEGRNHYYEFYMRGLNDSYSDWASYTWPSIDILDPEEVESARQDMDERTFRQEFEGSFESYEGLLYYAWEDKYESPVNHDPNKDLWLSCDFNKSPMVWDIYQLHERRGRKTVQAIDEIDLPTNAKTQQAAREFVRRYKDIPNKLVNITGDASDDHESVRDWTTDYIIIGDILKEAGFIPNFLIPAGNPSINNRINIACSLMANERILINRKCGRLLYDLQRNESNGKGGKNKEDLMQTHASDNFDYFIWHVFSGEFYSLGTVKQY